MKTGILRDDKARISFAIIAVVILIGAVAAAAYFQVLQKEADENPSMPKDEFGSVVSTIELELRSMALSALMSNLNVFGASVNESVDRADLSSLLDDYASAVLYDFDGQVKEGYDNTTNMEGIEVMLDLVPSNETVGPVLPTYDTLSYMDENGTRTRIVVSGFELDNSALIDMRDRDTGTISQKVVRVKANITARFPTILDILLTVDLSKMDAVISSMTASVAFAKAYGLYHDVMSIDMDALPGPNETDNGTGLTAEDGFVMGFDADIGPVPADDLLPLEERYLLQDLAVILFQLRTFGRWDNDFVQRFLDAVGNLSLSEEARSMTQDDLADMIGRYKPNYVNVEELAIQLFQRMGRVPNEVNIVGPLLRKMLDHGFMGLLGDAWEKVVDDSTKDSWALAQENMFDGDGFLTDDLLEADIFLLSGYGTLLREFLTLMLYYILKAYHFDRPEEVKEVALYLVGEVLEGSFLKNVPDKVAIPNEKEPWFQWDMKEDVKRAAYKVLELSKMFEVDLFDMKFNGYSLVYLFFARFGRADVDHDGMMEGYEEVFDEWMDKVRTFVNDTNLTYMNLTLQTKEDRFDQLRTQATENMTHLEGVDLSMNGTMNGTVAKALVELDHLLANLSKARPYLDPNNRRFFNYPGTGDRETADWRTLNGTWHDVVTGLTVLSQPYAELVSELEDCNNSTHVAQGELARSYLYNASTLIEDGSILMDHVLDLKWRRDVMVESLELIDEAGPTATASGPLYEAVALLSNNIEPHGCIGLNGTIEQLAEDLGNASSDAKGFENKGEKVSIRSILKDDRGIKGLINLMITNLEDLFTTFVEEMEDETWVKVIEDKAWEQGAGHDTLEGANDRYIYQALDLSRASVALSISATEKEIGLYEDSTPLEIYKSDDRSYDQYSEHSFLCVKAFVLGALAHELGQLDDIFNNTELFPAISATFGHMRMGADGTGPEPFHKVRVHNSWVDEFGASGQRVFANSSTVKGAEVFNEYLNPFSEDWYDYYLTAFYIRHEHNIRLALNFRDEDPVLGGAVAESIETVIEVEQTTTVMLPTPSPIVDIRYRPVSDLLVRPRSANLDRNVFSNMMRIANVNFSYQGFDEHNVSSNVFKVKVEAKVENIVTSAIAPLMLLGLGSDEENLCNIKDLTETIRVVDNGELDQDPRAGHVSVKVEIDIDKLKTDVYGAKLMDSEPMLLVKVWRKADWKTLVSERALRSAVGMELFSTLPAVMVAEQGFVYFVDEPAPELPVFDVGVGDEEVDVPWEMNMDDLFGRLLPPVNWAMFDPDVKGRMFPRSDPRLATVYDLRCEFEVITDIPPDSMIYFKNYMPFLVDFDGGIYGSNLWLRDWHLGYVMFMKDVPSNLEGRVFGVLPKTFLEESVDRLTPPSEYKFVRIYDFVPVHLQYFLGYDGPPDWDEIVEDQEMVITWDDYPRYYHMPTRAIPINVYRGKLVSSLWYDMLDELGPDGFTLGMFVPDIMNAVLKEMGDIIGFLKFSGNDALKGLGKEAAPLSDSIKWKKIFKDVYKLVTDESMPEMILSTPGAEKYMDMGANVYLGFDVGYPISEDIARKTNDDVLFKMGLYGLYLDVKTLVKVAIDMIKTIMLIEKGPKEKKYDSYSVLKDQMKNFKRLVALFKEYKLWLEGKDYIAPPNTVPELFRLQMEYDIDAKELKENGGVAYETGYSIVDVSLLRHRNGFTLDEIRALRSVGDYSKDEVEGFACVPDLPQSQVGNLYFDNKDLGIKAEEYCSFGHLDMEDWEIVQDLRILNVDEDVLRTGAQLGIPMATLDKMKIVANTIEGMIEKAEDISHIPGSRALFEGMDDLYELATIEAAYDNKDAPGVFIRPLGRDGPDVYTYEGLSFTYGTENEMHKKRIISEFLSPFLKETYARAYKNSEIYLYFDRLAHTDLDLLREAMTKVAIEDDRDVIVTRYHVMGRGSRVDFLRTTLGLVEIA